MYRGRSNTTVEDATVARSMLGKNVRTLELSVGAHLVAALIYQQKDNKEKHDEHIALAKPSLSFYVDRVTPASALYDSM